MANINGKSMNNGFSIDTNSLDSVLDCIKAQMKFHDKSSIDFRIESNSNELNIGNVINKLVTGKVTIHFE
jgi:hypothetical protein